MLVALAGIVPVLIMRGVFLNSYEKCAVGTYCGDTESMYHSQ
mgnify:CR=1 FL=1